MFPMGTALATHGCWHGRSCGTDAKTETWLIQCAQSGHSFTSRALTLLQTSAHLIHMQLTSDGSGSTENCDLT